MTRARDLADIAQTATGGIEGTEVKSTGESGGAKYLREDGDGTSSWQTVAQATTGISNGNTLVANANVADNDFLRVDGTSIEGRTSTEMLSDLGSGTPGSGNFLRGDGSWQAVSGGVASITDNGNATAITIDSSENVTLNAGNLIVTSGKGIDFSATSGSASGSASAVLDDYEEGTADVTFTNNSGNANSRTLHYRKIGDLVWLSGRLAADHNGTGGSTISGLPFTVANDISKLGGGFSVYHSGNDIVGIKPDANATTFQFYVQSGSNFNSTWGIPSNGEAYVFFSYLTT